MSQANGGPAFPAQTVDGGCDGVGMKEGVWHFPGMTLHDYFMAHAPTEPQPWFKPAMPAYPGVGVWVSDDGLRKYTDMFAAERAEGDAFTLFNQAEVDNWKAAFAKQRYTQWPAAWADEMIQQRSKP